MIHSARPTVPPVEITIFLAGTFCFGDFETWGRTYGRTDTTFKNSVKKNDTFSTKIKEWILEHVPI